MDFLWDDSSWLVSRFWLVGYPFFVINFSNLQNFVGASHIRSVPPATGKSCLMLVYWCFVIVYRVVWFFYDQLLASSDLHFARLVSWREGRMNLVGPSRNIICFIHFLLVGDFSFIRGCRKHECTRMHFKINRVCFYCPSGLEFIGYSSKSLWIRISLHMLTQSRRMHINV